MAQPLAEVVQADSDCDQQRELKGACPGLSSTLVARTQEAIQRDQAEICGTRTDEQELGAAEGSGS